MDEKYSKSMLKYFAIAVAFLQDYIEICDDKEDVAEMVQLVEDLHKIIRSEA